MLVPLRSNFWRRCRGWEWFWFHIFVNIFFSVLVCRAVFTNSYIAEGYSCLPLPALESRNLASYTLPWKSKTSRANAAILWHVYFVFCRDLAHCKYCCILLLIICFNCLHTAIIKELKYGIWTLLKRFRHLHLGTYQFNFNILYFVLLLWSGLRCTYGIAYSIGQTRGWFTRFMCYCCLYCTLARTGLKDTTHTRYGKDFITLL